MDWYSTHGTGAILYGVTPAPDARVEFTAWLCVAFVPLVPFSSSSALYAGDFRPTASSTTVRRSPTPAARPTAGAAWAARSSSAGARRAPPCSRRSS